MKPGHTWKTKLLYLIFSLWIIYAVIQGVNKILKSYSKYQKFRPIGSSITEVRLRQYPVAYSLVLFCNKNLPEGTGILFVGSGTVFVRFSYYMYPKWRNVIFGQKGLMYDRPYFERTGIGFVIVDKQEKAVIREVHPFAHTNGFYIFKTNSNK